CGGREPQPGRVRNRRIEQVFGETICFSRWMPLCSTLLSREARPEVHPLLKGGCAKPAPFERASEPWTYRGTLSLRRRIAASALQHQDPSSILLGPPNNSMQTGDAYGTQNRRSRTGLRSRHHGRTNSFSRVARRLVGATVFPS